MIIETTFTFKNAWDLEGDIGLTLKEWNSLSEDQKREILIDLNYGDLDFSWKEIQ